MIARAAAALALVGFAAAGVQTWRLDMVQDEMTAQALLASREIAAAEKAARAAEELMADSARKAAQTYALNVNRVRADAAGARTELDRLRDTLAAAAPSEAASSALAAARVDVANRLAGVVNECSAALSAVAEAADRAEARVVGWQEWAKAVLPKP